MKEKKQESVKEQGLWVREAYRTAGITFLVAVVLFVCSILGSKRNADYRTSSLQASASESYLAYERESLRELEKESIEASMEESLRQETAVCEAELTYMEERLLSLIMGYLEAGDLEGAARVMNLNRDLLDTLYFDKLAEGFYLYDGSRMTGQADGSGLVFSRVSAVFYGEFRNGVPSGQCLALQAVDLPEGVRYDYSRGSWKDGQMEGMGETGYHYYEGVSGDAAKQIKKEGAFSKDLMEGDIIYTSTNSKGESAVWTMTVKNGIIQPDDRWSFTQADSGAGLYRLPSDTDSSHAYAIDADAVKLPSWKNNFSIGVRDN